MGRSATPRRREVLVLGASLATLLVAPELATAETTLLNVSYDPTREFYADYNAAFIKHWKATTGGAITIHMSHGGSGSQARAVINGLPADVVTLALQADIDAIAKMTGKIPENWRARLPGNSCPYASTIVFLVRKGNPKGLKDWGDLVKDDVQVITPNPKTSGGARWNFLAAWGWAQKNLMGDETKMRDFLAALYRHVPVLDTGARGSTTTFVRRGIGDVLLAWENEALLAQQKLAPGEFQIVMPSISIKAEPPVALVDGNVDPHGTRKPALAYLEYLYKPMGQRLAAKHFYRPYRPQLADPEDLKRFPKADLVTIDQFGGWAQVQPRFFGDSGVFDQIYRPAR